MKIVSTLIISCLLSTYANALPSDLTPCREKIIMSYTNLEQARFQERFYIKTKLEGLLAPEITDAYQLSLPLLISAQLGEETLYKQSLNLMNKAMEQVDSGPFKAWLYGRIVFAAHSIKDKPTETQTALTLNNLMSNLIKDDSLRLDRFTIWSLGYTAALSKSDFNNTKALLKNGGDFLTNKFLATQSKGETEDKIQEARSDALWAWVLIVQAAANAPDEEFYDYAVEQMQLITKQSTLTDALSKGLLRTAASNDYPAWAIGIASLSAEALGKNLQYIELQPQLNASIAQARQGNHIAEALLGMVNGQLAIERDIEINQCPVRAKL